MRSVVVDVFLTRIQRFRFCWAQKYLSEGFGRGLLRNISSGVMKNELNSGGFQRIVEFP